MRHLLLASALLFIFTACEDKEQQAKHDAAVAAQARADLLAEQKSLAKAQQTDNKTLYNMGIQMGNGTITIDTNKTKGFFQDVNAKIATHVEKMSDDMAKGIVDAKEAGIEINNETIHIDLNKTQTFFQDWAQKMQALAKEFDDAAKSSEPNHTKQ